MKFEDEECPKRRDIIPKFPTQLPGSFWGLTTFFNSAGYRNKVENYKIFRESSSRQGLNLICVELAFGNKPFELQKDDAEIMVQLRTDTVLWQKERLLNIGLHHLPADCDKVCWLDADIIFLNNSWIVQTSHFLKDYMVVQPYRFSVRLPKGKLSGYPEDFPFGDQDGQSFHGIGYGIAHYGHEMLSHYRKHGNVGFAWAARRVALDKYGFYDRRILGGADHFMAYAFYGNNIGDVYFEGLQPSAMTVDANSWRRNIFSIVGGSVFYTDGALNHLWHGSHKNRLFGKRDSILRLTKFDPRIDIKIDKNGCWEWASKKKQLQWLCRLYFWMRNEENSRWREIVVFFIAGEWWRLSRRMLSKVKKILIKKFNLTSDLKT